MNLPGYEDYIDIHTHGSTSEEGVFFINNLMAHEEVTPGNFPSQICSYGIHPWYVNINNISNLIDRVKAVKGFPNLIAIGEAGFDKLRGPSLELQRRAFEQQILISEETQKPVIIHCVRLWDELISSHKKLKPKMPWLVHGFRGKIELAKQLIGKGMYISFWVDFVIRPEAKELLKEIPRERIFLETDGGDVDIRSIYNKVANDMDIPVDDLISIIYKNFNELFSSQTLLFIHHLPKVK